MRVLIAEDDPISRRLLEALLSKWGYRVVVARNGQEAWDALQAKDAPRLAIIDWMMPGMDGVQVCRKVREGAEGSYTYLILLTAKNHKRDIIEGLDAGADDYITKPFEANELSSRLRAGKRILDLQAELISTRETLRVQATHDPLTGLPNRLLFSDRLSQRLAHARRLGRFLAVMYLDLDRFKIINDTLGHNVGDLLLKDVAARLGSCLRDNDTLARMGGDEFTVILPDIKSSDDAAVVARKALDSLLSPFVLSGREFFISASIGISIYPADGRDVETLVRNADTAMYRAKEQNTGSYHLYTESLNAAALERMALENDLRRALDRHEFEVYYQPVVNIETGRVLSMEALLRWRHPRFGLIYPCQFIPLAEETGLIVPISKWVLNTASAQNKAWQDQGFPPMQIAVNVSTRQLQQTELVGTISAALEQTGLAPSHLDLELTESALMSNAESAVEALDALKAMGIGISIDDFGTGYSSLSCLKKFPIDAVKIDRSFVKDVTTNPDDAAIAGAVVAMARSLKLGVIAEGVETVEQLEFMRSLNCDQIQGYFISPPAPADQITQMLEESDYAAWTDIKPAA